MRQGDVREGGRPDDLAARGRAFSVLGGGPILRRGLLSGSYRRPRGKRGGVLVYGRAVWPPRSGSRKVPLRRGFRRVPPQRPHSPEAESRGPRATPHDYSRPPGGNPLGLSRFSG